MICGNLLDDGKITCTVRMHSLLLISTALVPHRGSESLASTDSAKTLSSKSTSLQSTQVKEQRLLAFSDMGMLLRYFALKCFDMTILTAVIQL